MLHPYKNLPDHCFWPKAMGSPAPGHIDPITRSKLIHPGEAVATMGSCFAQHLAKQIARSGLNYYVPEQPAAGTAPEEARRRNYGVFSARYGNVYTVRQALQLFDRAFGHFQPQERAWQRADGRWVDPFRPQVEPDGFESANAVIAASKDHLGHVRDIFTRSKWLVFTLGLTEGWTSRKDGAVFPIAPGVAGGSYDPELHAFHNFTLEETWADLDAFLAKVASVNPGAEVLLTVSPVALMATYEPRHVLVSTVLSKSVLRVAADMAEKKYPHVIYFPSFEIITSPAAAGRYYEDDLRQVTELGVSHVMRLFSRHFIDGKGAAPAASAPQLHLESANSEVVCDEEVIQDAIRGSGLKKKAR
jgi:hypothetical protein